MDRPGRYGGSFENRTRFLREVVEAIRAEAPGLEIGVRLSAFDFAPFRPGPDGVGEPVFAGADRYRYAFGGDGTGLGIDLTEPRAFLDLLAALDIHLVCITAGSPYYCPHIQRPARFPPSDGYLTACHFQARDHRQKPGSGTSERSCVSCWVSQRKPSWNRL